MTPTSHTLSTRRRAAKLLSVLDVHVTQTDRMNQVDVYRLAMQLAHLVAPDADANELTDHEAHRGVDGRPALDGPNIKYGDDVWTLMCPMCDIDD